MTTTNKQTDERKQTTEKPAKPPTGGDPGRDAGVAGAGDNRQADDLDGNRSAGGAKTPGTNSPEVE